MPPSSLPAAARRSLLVYNLFFPLVLVALLPGLLLRMFRRGGFRENFGQRLGRYSAETCAQFSTGRWWWIHSISVGETGVALKLAHELHRREPALRLVVSVTTSTGFALVRAAAADWLTVIYNPIDAPSVVRAALALIRPARLVLIEGEAWPNLLAACHEAGIPTALANARLSPRSERRMRTARFWIAPIFNLIEQIFIPENSDRDRWESLGIEPQRLSVTGSIKFDTASDEPLTRQTEFRELLNSFGVPCGAPILVAGSTWTPEERTLAELLLELRADFPHLLLILVPRHIERTPQIVRELQSLPLRVARRNAAALGAETPDVLIIDATGELREWYGLASCVFIGKSLPGVRDIGGQNPAEPAALGKPTITGPHMENFRALMELLLSHDAILKITQTSDLVAAVRSLLQNPTTAAMLGTHARSALDGHRGATARTCAMLLGDA